MLNSIDKLFVLLEQFSTLKSQWGVRELAARTGLSPTLTHWYLKNLERHRVVRKNPETDKYEIGYRLFELANQNSQFTVVRRVAVPVMSELNGATGGTSVLRVLDGTELLCLASIAGSSSLRVHFAEGSRVPCNYGCVGKVIMAHMDERERRSLVDSGRMKKFTERTILDYDSLTKEWARIRLRGWAYTSEETIRGVRAVAAPLRANSDALCAALGVTFPAVSLPKSKVRAVAQAVVRAANQISRELGGLDMTGNTSHRAVE